MMREDLIYNKNRSNVPPALPLGVVNMTVAADSGTVLVGMSGGDLELEFTVLSVERRMT